MMHCFSDFPTQRDFVAAVRSDPDQVYLKGVWQGIERHLTLTTFLEVSSHLVILGPRGAWRVHIERQWGRGIVAKAMRLPRKGAGSGDYLRLT
jgi:hypothetical protein